MPKVTILICRNGCGVSLLLKKLFNFVPLPDENNKIMIAGFKRNLDKIVTWKVYITVNVLRICNRKIIDDKSYAENVYFIIASIFWFRDITALKPVLLIPITRL